MDDKIPSAEAASLLGVTQRRVRQLAQFLHGERDEMGNWWFDRGAVLEHAEVRSIQRRGLAAIQRLEHLEQEVERLQDAVDLLGRILGARLVVGDNEEAPEPGEGNPESGAGEQTD